MSTMADTLDELTVEGTLYEKLDDGAVRCFACGHRCLIREGKRGICQVRFNQGGTLRVPWGYVAALQSDPVEKKPFFHVFPGVNALTFGMLGCDFHCGYCFTGDTMIVTDHGPRTLAEIFAAADRVQPQPDGEIAYLSDWRTVAASGAWRKVRAVFRHPHRGKLSLIRPYYLPPVRCTPDHRLYATDAIDVEPSLIEARHLTSSHYLAIPRQYSFSRPQVIDTAQLLGQHQVTYHVRWGLSEAERGQIAAATEHGETSREIGARLGKSDSYIRHVRGKLARGRAGNYRTTGPLIEGDMLRFPNERQPGLPIAIPLGADMARLLGYYCAEGSAIASRARPNSYVLNFSFSRDEESRAQDVRQLLASCLGIDSRLVRRSTTLAVAAGKASAALLFKSLAGGRASEKRVPEMLFDAPRPEVEAFLEAYVNGDGHRYANGKVSITSVSRQLAYGVAALALKLGHLASLYDAEMPEAGLVQGRTVRRSPHQYTVVWYENSLAPRRAVETEQYYLVPLREVAEVDYDGPVYNMEVDEEHNYLAGFFAVSNCQNWLTSQAMRDPASDVSMNLVRRMTPQHMVELAHETRAEIVVSSYNEPLITSEWAVAIFKEARAAGLMCAYVSNGNNTPEVIDYIRPYISAYKVDLKSMNDKNYRKLGGVLQNTLDGIKRAHAHGLWVEVVTLIVPGFNDSSEELWDAARFLAGVSTEIPWHVTAFHKDYKMTDPDNTGAGTLLRAAEIGREAGLQYVYAGNLPGQVEEYEDTHCPRCNRAVVKRTGYVITAYHLTAEGACAYCGTPIPGKWHDDPQKARLHGRGVPLPVWS